MLTGLIFPKEICLGKTNSNQFSKSDGKNYEIRELLE